MTGIINEHKATREAVGIFDVCHMGEVHFRGPQAAAVVQRIVTNDIGKLYDGKALYTVMCHPNGGIIDDLIVYRLAADHYLAVINAANIAKDTKWFREQTGNACDLEDASDDTALIAFQGPKALGTLADLGVAGIADLQPFHLMTAATLAGKPVQIARTGYTGEDGVEIFSRGDDAVAVFEALLGAAEKAGGLPVGLGARDTLRLEARLPLYGQDLNDDTTPLEAGLGWVVKLDTDDFVGRDALRAQKERGIERKLAGFVMRGRGIARHDYPIHAAAGDDPGPVIGTVTSGGPGPTVGKNVGLGYVPVAAATEGTRLVIDCRGRMTPAEVVKGPFYRREKK